MSEDRERTASTSGDGKRTALIIVVDGKEREISFEELALSNNIALEALVRILARKGIISPEEFVEQLGEIERERTAPK